MKTKFYLLLLYTGCFLSSTIYPQTSIITVNLTKSSLINLKEGINSENEQLCQSSMLQAGNYKINEVVNNIIKVLESCKSENTKMMAVLTLYKIGDEKSLETIKNAAQNEENPNVKKFCRSICQLLKNYNSVFTIE